MTDAPQGPFNYEYACGCGRVYQVPSQTLPSLCECGRRTPAHPDLGEDWPSVPRFDAGPPRIPDPPKPLTEAHLAEFERVAIAFLKGDPNAERTGDPTRAELGSSFAKISRRLVAEVRRLRMELARSFDEVNMLQSGMAKQEEVRRLRQLVVDAEPHVPDNDATQAMNLRARLRAEVQR